MKKRFKRKISNYTTIGSNYKEEFRTQLRMFIMFTLGFTIAFTWREYMFEGSKKFVIWLTKTQGSGAFLAAIFITIMCFLFMFLTARWLKKKHSF